MKKTGETSKSTYNIEGEDEEESPLSPTRNARRSSIKLLKTRGEEPIADQKEIYSWYCYDWANSNYSAIVITFFAPILLNTLAKKYANADYETCDGGEIWGESGNTFDFSAQTSNCTTSCLTCQRGDGSQIWNCATGQLEDLPSSTVPFLGFDVSPFSFTTTVISISVAFQALLFILAGPCADHGNMRKKLFVGSILGGTISTMALIFVAAPEAYWFAGFLVIVSNCFFGLSVVFYNAYLPLLVDAHPKVRELKMVDSDKERRVREDVENDMSSKGFISGYVGSVFLLVVSVILAMILPSDGTITERVCIFIAGAWWLGFSFFPIMYLKPRPGPPLEDGNTYMTSGKMKWITKGITAIVDAIRSAKTLPNTLIFLVLYFIYSDGYGTIGSVGVLFATENMCMGSMSMGLLVLEITISAILGGYFVLWIQKKYEIKAKTVVIACLSIYVLLPLYGLLGFATSDGGLGLKNEWEMFVFGFIYGSQLGAVQSYTRTVFSDLTPPGREAEFFSLYEITDKGSSWMGPLIVGIMHGSTGDIRYSFFYILAVMLIPILGLIFLVDHEAGMRAVGRLHDEQNDGDERDTVIFGKSSNKKQEDSLLDAL